jgi:hypothetical protein
MIWSAFDAKFLINGRFDTKVHLMSTLRLITFAAVFLAVGFLAGCLVAILLSVIAIPGGRLAMVRKGASAFARGAGLLVAVVFQSYVALAFAAIVAESARSIVGGATGIGKWIFWHSAFLVAITPAAVALRSLKSYLKDSTENYSPADVIGFRATTPTSILGAIGFIVFALFPHAVSWGWAWVPHF